MRTYTAAPLRKGPESIHPSIAVLRNTEPLDDANSAPLRPHGIGACLSAGAHGIHVDLCHHRTGARSDAARSQSVTNPVYGPVCRSRVTSVYNSRNVAAVGYRSVRANGRRQ